jgi:uncharacterized protein (DUF58 family)
MRWFRRRDAERQPVAAPKRIRQLELLSARLVQSGLAGQYHAAFHGHGLEFAQVREYQPGDDVRTIDWNVTARSGIPHVKQYVEERDLNLLVMLDVSGSMSFGSKLKRKSDVAIELLSIFAFAALENGDRVGLLMFDDRVRLYRPPSRRRGAVLRMLREAVAHEWDRKTTGFSDAAEFARRVLLRRSVVVVVSDFLGFEAARALEHLAVRHDLVALHLVDPREERFPARGLIRLVDAESGEEHDVDLRARAFLDAAARRTAIDRSFRAAGTDRLEIAVSSDYDRDLMRFFASRRLRSRRRSTV